MTPQQRFDRRFSLVGAYLLNIVLAAYILIAYSLS